MEHTHVVCGAKFATLEEAREHVRVCPEKTSSREEEPVVVDAGGQRIVAGHPDAVRRYMERG